MIFDNRLLFRQIQNYAFLRGDIVNCWNFSSLYPPHLSLLIQNRQVLIIRLLTFWCGCPDLYILETSNPQPIGFSGILLAKRQNSFYCTYFLHNRNVADTKSPYPIKRLEVIRWFNQKSMVFNQSLSWTGWHKHCCLSKCSIHAYVMS